MEQTSKLSIVVDTSKAASQIKAFSSALKQMEKDGESSSKALSKIGSGVNFSALNSSINTARASLSAFTSTANNASIAMNQAAKAAAQLRTATQGIATNLNAAASAAGKIASITTAMNNAKVSASQFGSSIKGVNANVVALNATLNVGIATLNRYGQAAFTAGQRTTAFGQATTQSQTRLRGLDAGLLAARNNMTALTTAANSINAIFGNLNSTMAQLAAATNRLSDASTRAAAQIQRLDNGLGGANARGRTFMGTLQGLQGLLMGGMFSIATLGIIKTADEMQNLNSQIKLVTNSEAEYLGIRQKVRELADKNFSDIKSMTGLYADSARSLANLGKSQAEVLKFTDAVSLAMRAGGRSAQEQASAILQLGQGMSANVILGDEFRSLSENAPILLELVAKKLGVLPGQLKALAADGKITGEVMHDALTENMAILEEMAKKMPITMAQAFTVAKNRYKSYVDDMMNQTGGMSGKIASMIEGMSANFDTLAKVAIAGVTLAFANMALSIGTASTAMAIFNTIASMNPLILIAGGFIAVSSAIFGVNDVLTISGIMLGDFFDAMGVMLRDGETWWMDFSDTVAVAMGGTVNSVADANDKNSKNFLGFYEKTEKGFAGVVQGLSTALLSVTNIFMAALTVIDNYILNTNSLLNNLGIGLYNAGQKAKGFFGGEDNSKEYLPYAARDTNYISVYKDGFSTGQDNIREKVQSWNQRAGVTPTPLDKQWSNRTTRGLGFSNVLTPGANSVLKPQAGQLPDYLKPEFSPSTDPMDEIKKSQFEQMKANDALEEATKAAAKEAKERAKRERELNKGLSNRLVGISGDTGVGNAHLHIQYRDKSRPVSPADLARFKAGDKRITDYPMTSGYGKRNTGIKGASTNHKGTDFAIPKNTGITTNVAVKSVKTWQDSKGGGYVSTITFEDGVVIDLLHQMPSVMGVDKGSSTGNKQIDSMISKAENAVAKEAAKAEKERIKAAEEAQKERERIAAIDLKLLKEYGDKELQLTIEHDARVAEINESSFNSARKAELIAESERRMKQELDVYKKGLDDRVNEFAKYKQTERDILKQQYNDDVFGILSDPVLSRPEHKDRMTEALANARLLNDYRLSLYEQSLEQEKSAMYAFQKTERQILIDEGVARLANAKLQQDELSAYRVDAVEAEEAYKLNIFDTNHALQMLDLKKSHMSQMQYIREKYELEKQLVGLSNATPETKALQLEALRDPAKVALKDMLGGIEQQSPMAKIRAEYEANLLILEEYEQKYTDMIGVQTEARLAIEQSYMNAKRDLFLTQGEELFGALAGLSKSFVGEQAGTYRLLYGIQKGFAVASAGIALWQSVSEASKAPIPAKWGLMAAAAADGAKLVSTITSLQPQGFKQGGYTGNMGVNQVAGAVHGQEYVFDAQATKRIGVDNLNAMRSGKAPVASGGDNINVNVTVHSNGSSNVESDKQLGRNMGQVITAAVKQQLIKEKRQGGLLYG